MANKETFFCYYHTETSNQVHSLLETDLISYLFIQYGRQSFTAQIQKVKQKLGKNICHETQVNIKNVSQKLFNGF